MSDEELDNLFRKSIESFEPPYDPEAWTAMDEKLDSLEAGQSWWTKLFFPLLIIIYTCSIVTVTQLAQRSFLLPNTITKASAESSLPEESTHLRIPEKGNFSGVERVQELPNGAVSTSSQREEKKVITTMKGSPGSGRKAHNKGIKEKPTTSFEGATKLQSLSSFRWSENQNYKTITPTEGVEKLNPKTVPLHDSAQDLSTQTEEGISKAKDNSGADIENKSALLNSIQISLLVAPDLTSVKFKNPDAISTNAGLMVGIPLTKRISVVSGVIWANKVYGATPEDYVPSPDYWNGNKLPASIDAVCRVLDIPVNIRYQVFEKDRNSVAVQAGISSYIMLSEKYSYNYAYGYTPYTKESELSNENRHWFGVQNISVSYNRKLSPALSVGVEPFMKFPLTGIGEGRVKLTSAGVFLTAGYSVSLRK